METCKRKRVETQEMQISGVFWADKTDVEGSARVEVP